jgi:16S rRNA (adenine1518-N6/adenine1519-N6)-dimethyltransferase
MHITSDIKSSLKELGIKPNKRLGQNFLINKGVYNKLISAVDPQRGETIVEIGPGLGTVTQYLVDKKANVIAIEKDLNLIPYLQQKFIKYPNVQITQDDILKWNPESLIPKTSSYYKIVGNLPYYLTAHLLKTIFFNWPKPQTITIMVQREVADKLMAKPPNMRAPFETKSLSGSYLGITTQFFVTVKKIAIVKPDNFYPTPDVDSAIIQLTPQNDWNVLRDNIILFRLISAGFGQKRKQLLNALSTGLKLTKATVGQLCKDAKIDPKRRAQTLSMDEWSLLASCAQQSHLKI